MRSKNLAMLAASPQRLPLGGSCVSTAEDGGSPSRRRNPLPAAHGLKACGKTPALANQRSFVAPPSPQLLCGPLTHPGYGATQSSHSLARQRQGGPGSPQQCDDLVGLFVFRVSMSKEGQADVSGHRDPALTTAIPNARRASPLDGPGRWAPKGSTFYRL